jgi:hypothetical protein
MSDVTRRGPAACIDRTCRCSTFDSRSLMVPPQNLNQFMMIVGKPGSSKTALLLNMVCKRGKMYNKKFDRVYLWSPSLGTIDDCPFNDLPEDQVHQELTGDNLEGVQERKHGCVCVRRASQVESCPQQHETAHTTRLRTLPLPTALRDHPTHHQGVGRNGRDCPGSEHLAPHIQ